MKRGLYSVLFAVVVVSVGFGIYAWHPSIAPIKPPAKEKFSSELIEKGKVLAAAGYCSTCHTASGGKPLAGNYEIHSEFGTIYSSNITPDPETGIGNWSEDAFARAMRTGVSRDGSHLLPAFPYEHFNKMSDEDIKAVYAYIMSSVEPVHQEKKENGIPFPLNLRFLQAGWKLLFADSSDFEPNPNKSDEWNRGAYLAEGITHCGACHAPRNVLGGEKHDEMYSGAPIDGWIAPSLTSSSTSPLKWRKQDFVEYLSTGNSLYHGSAGGPMAPVVHDGLAALSQDDIQAIATYFADKAGNANDDPMQSPELQKAVDAQKLPDLRIHEGARLYAASCQSCHYSEKKLVKGRPLLTLGSAVHLDEPTNLINVILDGFRADQGIKGVVMPGFRDALSDEDITAVAAYLRETAGEKPWPNLEKHVGEIRRQPRFEQ